MNTEFIAAVLDSSSEQEIADLLGDESTVFWIDWSQEDERIVDACEGVLQTGRLAGELVETDREGGYEVYIRYGEKRMKVPLTYTPGDRHVTLCTLNEVLSPDYEVRYCIDSHGSDSAAFLPLPTGLWTELEGRYGDAVFRRFSQMSARPNLFTDRLQFGGSRPWWRRLFRHE
jgi:hypothetical protein